MKTGLVLEGGGMRGLYTVGVLDALMDNDLHFDYVIGVSAGAGNAVSYLSGQRGRAFRADTKYVRDKRYIGLDPIVHEHSVFGLDFIFDTIPKEYEPFDYEAFFNDPTEFYAVATDAQTGEPVYFAKDCLKKDDMSPLKASAALPLFSHPIEIDKKPYFDGGVSDAIPAQRALDDGCDQLVIVLTRPRGYQKSARNMRHIFHAFFKDYPNMTACMERRHKMYNDELALCDRLEQEGKALILAPRYALPIDKFGTDLDKLEYCYYEGMRDCKHDLDAIRSICAK